MGAQRRRHSPVQKTTNMYSNERGTAAAIRALMSVGAAPREVASTVTVELDGKVIETVKVDPKDPLKSTMALAHLDLERLGQGRAIGVGGCGPRPSSRHPPQGCGSLRSQSWRILRPRCA